MELCTSRHLLLSVFILQLIIVSVRQIFDFLGYMWASVLANFIFTLFVIFGIFGIIQTKSRYSIAYTVSSFYWFFWNIFIMFIYYDVLGLYKFRSLLSFRTNSTSWWEMNGPGCKVFLSNLTMIEEDPYQPITPDYVTGCVIDFRYIEGIQAALHAVLAMWGFLFGIKVSNAFMNQNDCSVSTKEKNSNLPLYSIEYSPRRGEEIYDEDVDDDQSSDSPEELVVRGATMGVSHPMTPRRVKRRNVNSKSSVVLPQYPRKQNQQPPPYIRRPSAYGSMRSSDRSSIKRPRSSLNPVSKFLQQQQQQLPYHHQMLNDSSTSNDSCRGPFSSSRSQLLNAAKLMNNANLTTGHINQNFVSNTSLDRPLSARSSYSNYHGVRTLAFNKHATAQVPSNSMHKNFRSTYSTFLNDGPPAYEIQNAVNTETVI